MPLYIVDNTGDELWSCAPDAPGSATLVGALPSDLTFQLGITNVGGTLYILNTDVIGTTGELWSCAPDAPADAVLVGAFPTDLSGPTTPTTSELWSCAPDAPGDATLIGAFPSDLLSPTGLTNIGGTLYILDTDGDELWSCAPDAPGSAINVGAFPSGLSGPTGITNVDGTLYIVDNTGDELWSCAPDAPGSATLVGALPSDVGSPQGLVYISGVIPPVLGTLYNFDTLNDFTALFPDALTTNAQGTWRYEFTGTTGSVNTGPGTNNMLSFVHTETSGSNPIPDVELRGVAHMDAAAIPSETGRTLHIRACIQGDFGDGVEGLIVRERASDSDPWVVADAIHGWAYGTYSAGDMVTDENGVDRVIAADGGWIDFTVDVADSTTQIELMPEYIVVGSVWFHDIALRSMRWEWSTAPSIQSLAMAARSGNPTAAFALITIAPPPPATQQLSMSARAGDPTSTLSLTAVAAPVIPTQILAMSARAGNPTVSLDLAVVAVSSGYVTGNVLVDTRASGASSTLDLPVHSAGDQLIILVGHSYAISPIAQIPVPTGWTAVREGEAGSTSAVGLAAWSKIGDGSESTTTIPAIPAAVPNTVVAIAIAVSGVINIESVALTMQESGVDIDSPSITPSAIATILRAFVFDDNFSSETDYDSDSNFLGVGVGYGESSSPGNGLSVGFGAEEDAAAGAATGTSTWSSNGDSDAGMALTIALTHGGVAPPTQFLSMSAEAGSPTATFDLTAIDAPVIPTQPLDMAARAGNPTATFDLTAVAAPIIPTQALSMSARSGSPTASFALTSAAPSPVPAPIIVVASELDLGLAGYPHQTIPVRWRWQRRSLAYNLIDDISTAISVESPSSLILDNDGEITHTIRGIELIESRLPSDFDPVSDNIALVEQRYIQGTWRDFPLGLFRLIIGDVQYSEDGDPLTQCDGADLNYILTQSGPEEPYTVPSGTAYKTAIETILTARGLNSRLSDLASTTPLVHTWAPWPETSWYDIIRQLSDGVHYTTPYTNFIGRYIWKPRAVIESAAVTYSDSDEPRMIESSTPYLKGQEVGQLPNVAVVLIDDPRRYMDGVFDDYRFYKKTNADATSPLATTNPLAAPRGEVIMVVDSDSNPSTKTILDAATANNIADWTLDRAGGEFFKATLHTLPDPRRDAHEWYNLDIDGVEDNTLWRVISWTRQLSLEGAHRHTLAKATELTIT